MSAEFVSFPGLFGDVALWDSASSMFSRLATVLQELSGEEGADGEGELVPRLPDGDDTSESEVPEEAMERLAHLEQLVVQLKELIRDKDSQLLQKNTELINKDAQIKSEGEAAEARFTKLKLQAKAKMASLTKQINDLKGQEGIASPDTSFTGAGGPSEEEIQELRTKLSKEKDENKSLRDKLQATEQLLQDQASANADQVRILQAVICEKDVRFHERIQEHEEEMLRVTSESHNEELQQAFHAAQRRCEELEETVASRSQVLEMLQQELNSADQQKQILSTQFRQMEQELADSIRLREEEKQHLTKAQAEISSLRNGLEAWEAEKAEVARLQIELGAMKEAEILGQEALQREKTEVTRLEQELAKLRESEAMLETHRAEMELVEKELQSLREAETERLAAVESEKSEVDKLNNELMAFREEREQLQEQRSALNEAWTHLRSLDLGDSTISDEGPVDPTQFMQIVGSIEAQLLKLREEQSNSEKRCQELYRNIDTLQEQLDMQIKSNEEVPKIQDQQSKEMPVFGHDSTSTHDDTERISFLEQQLQENGDVLSALQGYISLNYESVEATEAQNISLQSDEDNRSVLQDLFEEPQEEETTLVAENTSVLSMSADNESSPEPIETHSESPEESKASSDEMVASSDSEVAHSSWTLLEAVNQEGGQEWPSMLHDYSQLQSSWEATSMEPEMSTVETSQVIIQEDVEVRLTQQTSSVEQEEQSQAQMLSVQLEEKEQFSLELKEKLHDLSSHVSHKDELIASLQEDLRMEKEKTQRLEVEVPQKQEEEKDSETKLQQQQRKLQAALISRKEALKENKSLKEQIASIEQEHTELKEKMAAAEQELVKFQTERERLISEVDRLLLDNQSLDSSCESLKLVMEGILSEKENCQKEAELVKEEAARARTEWEERVRGMKEEYETLLKSYENQSKESEKNLLEEGDNRETHFKEALKNLETEKDNLEERLMNQLAQLNGSIASYQQEAADQRQQLAEMQCEMETLERARAELEAEYQSEQAHTLRLEEDIRQAQRLRAEAEAQCGKQRELQQQLRSAERVKEGSQSRSRQLEELLREKQLEVRQLQKDTIQYQERISELGREAKAQQITHDELLKKHQQAQLELSKTVEDFKRAEIELSDCKSQLNSANEQLREALADKAAVEKKALQKEGSLKAEAEETLDSVRFRLGAELKEMELRLEESFREREKEEEATAEAREQAEAVEKRAQGIQTQLDESLARLAAFSRCMSSLQNDRDRILDEARQWENRFNSALQGKEAEVREAETRVKVLTEQLQKEIALKEDLQISIESLQKADKEWKQKIEDADYKFKASEESLEKEKSLLVQTTAALQAVQSEALSLQKEVESSHHRLRALEEAVGRVQAEADQARAEVTQLESEGRRLCLSVEQLEADLRSSKTLTEDLQMELNEKERKEVEMLGEKEQAVAQAAEEARKEAESRAQEVENELELKRRDMQQLDDKMRKVQAQSDQNKTRLESFTKAMGSLQDDRDRVLSMYKQLEEKHLKVMMEKDGLIQEAAGENNSLKDELRSLLVQRDDLYAEKAKLEAQLHGYREELNQVLSMKESQHQQLLSAQRLRIATLEKEHKEMENQLRSLNVAKDSEGYMRLEAETLSLAAENKSSSQVVDAPGAEVEKLREQLEAAKKQVTDLEDTLSMEREAHESKSKELAELKWEGGVMRTESESAQERVAELARDLLIVEQKLLKELEVTQQLRAENQAFSKAMASLQNSRDQAVQRAQELALKVEEPGRADGNTGQSGSARSTGEVWGLKNALQALQNDRERLLEQLESQSTELKRQKSDLSRLGAGELIKVSQELFEEKEVNKDLLGVISELENTVKVGKQEIDALHVERVDILTQAEQLKQQTLATLSERDQQLRHLAAMLDEVQNKKTQLQEQYQRQGAEDGAPGAPQQKSTALETHGYVEEIKELQRRLDQESQQRIASEDQLQALQDRARRHSQAHWNLALEEDPSETAVFIEPPEGVVTRMRRVGSPGLLRMFRVVFCSRQRTPLLFSLYLLTVHVLLLLCLGGSLQPDHTRRTPKMWKSVVGHNLHAQDATGAADDWETDPDFENDITEQEQRWGAKTIEGSGRKEHISVADLRQKVVVEHERVKQKENTPKASYGYGGRFGVEKDRMDRAALGHDYVAKVEQHSSQKDASQGFGGKFGVQADRVDESALGFEYKGEVQQHASQKDYSKGFGGKYGVEKDKVDKAALGYDYKGETEKHQSQKDYAKGFGGKFGVEKDKVDKVALGYDYKGDTEKHQSQKDYSKGFGGKFGIEKEKTDKSALGFDYKAETEKHQSQKGKGQTTEFLEATGT
uniref:Golgin subfamily B member 1 n=2 Tax=Knipowitschia caucasica TaxID=637954 RepID=A0AAV2IZJ8_KNICA